MSTDRETSISATPLMRRRRLALAGAMALLVVSSTSGCASRQKTVRVQLPESVRNYETESLVEGHALAAEAFRMTDPLKAMVKYQDAVNRYRELPAAWNNLGVLLMEADRYIQAQEAFNQAALLAPNEPRPLYNLGLLYDRRGYVREARKFYDRALTRDDSYLPALRAAIRADSILHEGSEQTLEWLERALMLERDQDWRDWMLLQRVRIENRIESDRDT